MMLAVACLCLLAIMPNFSSATAPTNPLSIPLFGAGQGLSSSPNSASIPQSQSASFPGKIGTPKQNPSSGATTGKEGQGQPFNWDDFSVYFVIIFEFFQTSKLPPNASPDLTTAYYEAKKSFSSLYDFFAFISGLFGIGTPVPTTYILSFRLYSTQWANNVYQLYTVANKDPNLKNQYPDFVKDVNRIYLISLTDYFPICECVKNKVTDATQTPQPTPAPTSAPEPNKDHPTQHPVNTDKEGGSSERSERSEEDYDPFSPYSLYNQYDSEEDRKNGGSKPTEEGGEKKE